MITYSIIFLLIAAFIAPVKNKIKILYLLSLLLFLYLFNIETINNFFTQTAYATRNKAFCSLILFDEDQERITHNCNKKVEYMKYEADVCRGIGRSECIYGYAEGKMDFNVCLDYEVLSCSNNDDCSRRVSYSESCSGCIECAKRLIKNNARCDRIIDDKSGSLCRYADSQPKCLHSGSFSNFDKNGTSSARIADEPNKKYVSPTPTLLQKEELNRLDFSNEVWEINSAAHAYRRSCNTYQGLKEYLSSLTFPLDYSLREYGAEYGSLNISSDGQAYCMEAYVPVTSDYWCGDSEIDPPHAYNSNPKCSETYFACE
jgi:hypothetical protein